MPRSRENKVNLRQLMISDHLMLLGAGSLELEEHLSLCFNGCRWTPFVHTKTPQAGMERQMMMVLLLQTIHFSPIFMLEIAIIMINMIKATLIIY